MRRANKTRYAILGMLVEEPRTGYQIKSFMRRSTIYFWRESDSTLYPMLKVLVKERMVTSKVLYVGRKKKEVFSITQKGRNEFKDWIKTYTSSEIPRNEFLLKLFFTTDQKEMIRLFHKRLEKNKKTFEEYKKIEERLESIVDSPLKQSRLKLLKYGILQLKQEIKWLKEGMAEDVNL